jgi:hypothetical protein
MRVAHEHHVAAFVAGSLDRPVLRSLVGIADDQRQEIAVINPDPAILLAAAMMEMRRSTLAGRY